MLKSPSDLTGQQLARPKIAIAPTASSEGNRQKNSGSDLLSQGNFPLVPSAQAGLTSVFEKGTGVTLPP